MKIHTKHLLLPLLGLGLSLALVAPLGAQTVTSGSIQITFGTTPHWTTVQGTQVRIIREQDRPAYDMFHYGNSYYVYDNDRWYSSRQSHGNFVTVDERYVPYQVSQVPQQHWHSYPTAWVEKNHDPSYNQHGKKHSEDHSGQQNGEHDKH